ncbi:MAG: thiosulfate oxidation carrier protein SoxY [Rhodospirillales bacterium]|nr:thiosulfate oxidation carrier protein SoxY [Rhodospirillales bacterium]MDH3910932.1 thiosulfate oxidation carrier protein SoxY [Rhodospirillales bacterium]MDH3917167.1 thiosulfate oxidation carrier protein SoxY [Rhodospirillales bacterium]MDH3968964.1 thiosulfate oxidation carrier protein SoxY [Rhodospirillales bacterium]
MNESKQYRDVSRRQALIVVGAGGLAAAGLTLLPQAASADAAAVDAAIKGLIGGKTPQAGRITLDLPQIAENGNTVPITVEVDSPMTEQDYCKAVHIFADKNPQPGVASINFTPACGKAKASTRMRLAKTQNVVAVAEMSDGSVYTAKAEVKVTIGGCGG